MRIVVDCNRVIASLIKDSTTRQVLFNKKFEFFAPSYIFSEIGKYKDYIIKKTRITKKEFDTLLSLIFENVKIISKTEYQKFIEQKIDLTKDINDAPYLAIADLIKADGIWTHDLDFSGQNKIKAFTNIDMLRLIKEDFS